MLINGNSRKLEPNLCYCVKKGNEHLPTSYIVEEGKYRTKVPLFCCFLEVVVGSTVEPHHSNTQGKQKTERTSINRLFSVT